MYNLLLSIPTTNNSIKIVSLKNNNYIYTLTYYLKDTLVLYAITITNKQCVIEILGTLKVHRNKLI
jgi:hypothetical protein